MAYLMEIGFDNSCRPARKTYLFQYRDTVFKLVQDGGAAGITRLYEEAQ